MGKGAKVPSSAEPQHARHLRPQQSSYGDAIAIVYGETRVAGHIVWADFFKAHAAGGSSAGSKAGGRVSPQSYYYTVACILSLGEGGRTNDDNPERLLELVNVGLARPGGQVLTLAEQQGATDPRDNDPANEFIDGGDHRNAKQPRRGAEPGYWRGKRVRQMGPRERGFRAGRFTEFNDDVYVPQPGTIIADFFSPGRRRQMIDAGTEEYAPENYPGTAIVCHDKMGLGSNASIPNNNFPFYRLRYAETDGTAGQRDAAPDRILVDLLTNWKHGAGWEDLLELLPGFNDADGELSPFWRDSAASWGAYVRALGILISPRYDSQRAMRQILEDLALITDSTPLWSEGLLKMIPYGDEAVAAAAPLMVAYTPETDPTVYTTGANVGVRAALTVEDFLPVDDDDPVKVQRKAIIPNERTSSGYFNTVRVEFENRIDAYSKDAREAKDDAAIATYGLIPRQPFAAPEITRPELAQAVAERILQRLGTGRDEYRFKLGWWWLLLEPMDVVTIPGELLDPTMSDLVLGVRIVRIEEDAEGALDVTAEQFPRAQAAVVYAAEPAVEDSYLDQGEVIVGGMWTVLQTRTDYNSPEYVDPTGVLSSDLVSAQAAPDPVVMAEVRPGRIIRWQARFTTRDPEPFADADRTVRLRFNVDGVSRPALELIFGPGSFGREKVAEGNLRLEAGQRVCVELYYMDENGQRVVDYRQYAFNWTIHWIPD